MQSFPARETIPSLHRDLGVARKSLSAPHEFAWEVLRGQVQGARWCTYCTNRSDSHSTSANTPEGINSDANRLFDSVPNELFLGLVLPALRLAFYRSVALARCVFQLFTVHDYYFSAAVLDQPGFLQHARSHSHTRATCTKHVRKELLCKPDDVSANAILAHQQPSSQALVHLVKTVTGSHLCGFTRPFLRDTYQSTFQSWARGEYW